MPNPAAILGAMGFDAEKIMKDFDRIGELVGTFDTRLTAIQENQVKIITLMEGVKANATKEQQ